ncbi:hypothetical protein ACRALDRAFT_207517 [Sodiomyces alcalophilus JCM 7366]|uniref:uncharacterized protein n=1 Tax=Sodiomyces alcalophilus JCM 7366 TaxID=591952 RepID=UPI0039B4E4E9
MIQPRLDIQAADHSRDIFSFATTADGLLKDSDILPLLDDSSSCRRHSLGCCSSEAAPFFRCKSPRHVEEVSTILMRIHVILGQAINQFPQYPEAIPSSDMGTVTTAPAPDSTSPQGLNAGQHLLTTYQRAANQHTPSYSSRREHRRHCFRTRFGRPRSFDIHSPHDDDSFTTFKERPSHMNGEGFFPMASSLRYDHDSSLHRPLYGWSVSLTGQLDLHQQAKYFDEQATI